MAILFIDGFDQRDTALKWGTAPSGSGFSTGRSGSGSSYSSGQTGTLYKSVPQTNQLTVGFGIKRDSTAGPAFYIYTDGGGTLQLSVSISNTSGSISLYRGSNLGGTLIATGTTTVPASLWQYIEVQATVSSTTGSVTARLNGSSTAVLTFSGNTKNGGTNSTIDTVGLYNVNTGNFYVDDLYMLDATGSTNTTFLGDVQVSTILPSGNGTYSQLTNSSGNSTNNYSYVNASPYSTATNVSAITTGLHDTYTLSALSASVSQILGVQNNLIADKSTIGTASAKSALLIGGNFYYGATRGLSTSYLTYSDVYQVNPNTSVAWTLSDISSLQAGMEVA